MAKSDGTPYLDALNTQDGTLATLASTLDYAKFEGTMTAEGKLPEAIRLANQLTLCKFNIKSCDGKSDITRDVTQFVVKNGSNTYTVNREAAAGPIYVAMQPVTTGCRYLPLREDDSGRDALCRLSLYRQCTHDPESDLRLYGC